MDAVAELEAQAAEASSSSARKGAANRARGRSVSSQAVPVTQLARTALSSLRTEALGDELDRGPGTPDFTLSSTNTPQWRRAEVERDRTMSSLGQGLQLISEAERIAGPSGSNNVAARARSGSDASHSSDSSDSHKKKATPRPRMSTLRSFFSSFSANPSAVTTPQTESKDAFAAPVQAARVQPLAMPSARLAAPNGLMGLNEDSPPLTPTDDPDEQSEYQHYVNAFHHFVPKETRHGPPKHQWSAAQAAADALAPSPSSWPFTPPLTASNATSPVPGSRAFSPEGILPSHLASSRSTTPTSTTTSDRSTRNIFDVDTYRIQPSTLLSLLPRLQINLSSWRLSMPNLRPYLPRLLWLFAIFAGSTVCIVLMLSTLPLVLPKHITSLSLTEIKSLALSLKVYSQSSTKAFVHTLLVLGAFFTWKQSFTVPGSLIMNVVFGAMYGTYSGTLYTSTLTAVGGVFCYLLSAPLGPLITSLPGLARPLDAMRRALSPARTHSDSSIWSYLLILRVLPIVPYGLMNIACGVLRVPLLPYAVTLAVGSVPWNFVTCQVGDLLQEIVEALPADGAGGGGMGVIVERIWNREMVVKLVLLSAASLCPMILGRVLKRRGAEVEYEAVGVDEVDDEESSRPGSRRTSMLREGLPTETVELDGLTAGRTIGIGRTGSIRNAWL
uniref:VTT domain-containing protein n=2 Tax=Kalmanozyma brasiliensis (strain GHG001) TaxID=1365824 RepID=V5F1A6_KALBG